MGYPLERTALAQLLDSIFEAQEGRVDGKYYAPHYLAVLRHPYIKNLRLHSPLTSNHQITKSPNHRVLAGQGKEKLCKA
jgi:hypothetical protein